MLIRSAQDSRTEFFYKNARVIEAKFKDETNRQGCFAIPNVQEFDQILNKSQTTK